MAALPVDPSASPADFVMIGQTLRGIKYRPLGTVLDATPAPS
ncbi:MAG: hypothetical protein U0841_00920 [Chloroflexia bacterium]